MKAIVTDVELANARERLGYWKADPKLTGVRDLGSLEGLPSEERQAWRAPWADVEAGLAE